MKLREITLGYELPAALTRSAVPRARQDVRLELSGRNLKTWTNYTGLDPEVSNFGNQAAGPLPGRDALSAGAAVLLLDQSSF